MKVVLAYVRAGPLGYKLLDYLFNNLFVTFIIKDIKVIIIKGRYKFYGGYGVPLLSEGFHHDATRLF